MDNLENLFSALEKSNWLEGSPGDARQKLRSAKSRYRRLSKVESLKGLVRTETPSPHAKDSYDAGEFDRLSAHFSALKWKLIQKPGGQTVKFDSYYHLWALVQQAREGNCTSERPSWAANGGIDFHGRAEWDAWSDVSGLELQECKLRFVKAYYEFSPDCLFKDTR